MSTPIIKWKTGGYRVPIERVECVKETAQFVWPIEGTYKPRQSAKRSDYSSYFDSWREARDYLLGDLHAQVNQERQSLADAEEKLADLMKLEEPKA